ncbi:MAG: hypothetical protein KKH99_06315, partial [Proteobacteria bacterium]|nr:hypothetical protein [Pseudomonadota bacterium]
MAGQICPIFERLSDDTITIIGAWMQHPINIQIIPDEYNFIEIQHISPILSSYLKNELCRSIPNDSTNVGRGCRFETGAFIMGCNHPAPNEKGGIYGRDFEYKMKDNQGVTILVREKISENPLTTNVQDNFHSNDSLSESNNHVTKSQNWFFAENQQKNVRQIITHDQNMEYQDSEFSNLALSGKYENLMSQKWVCGYFRTDDKPGPYLLVRADGHINYLKDCPIRIAFSFYRKPSAGLFGLFVAADTNDELKKVSPHGHAVFECIFGLDNADAVQRIKDALSKEEVRLCFADKSESLSQEVMDENGNFIEMSPPCCQFDRIFK